MFVQKLDYVIRIQFLFMKELDHEGVGGDMAKYRVEVGSFSTRFIQRRLTIYAKNEAEARKKAIDLYWEKELKACSVDPGEPKIDDLAEVEDG